MNRMYNEGCGMMSAAMWLITVLVIVVLVLLIFWLLKKLKR